MTDPELIAEITKTAIIPFIEETVKSNNIWEDEDDVWDVDTVLNHGKPFSPSLWNTDQN